jgi:ABC-2 type transport system permease protein
MKNILNTFWQIIFREIVIFFKILGSKFIDITIITTTNITVFTFLMPFFGLKSTYGPFIVVGLMSILPLFEITQRTTNFISDLTGNKKISYFLTLPLPSSFVLAAIPLGWAACNAMYSIFVIPLAKLLLNHKLDLSHFSFIKFLIGFTSTQIMYGFFALFLSSFIKDLKYSSWIWSRVVNPLFMLGGYFYTWMAINSVSHLIGFINLLNPVMISCECLRASILGQSGFLNFWATTLGIWLFTLFFAFVGIKRLKKRLDCV